ncbi:MAG: hypothetical protein AB7V56_03080 [Candidatus Nitrosocosmicus sp.]|jgi:hypothetical protein|uniref:hypothetical protein n=1 Tax=Candidatus Nitrosocosmicus agrestis TaxID=2563600 RepID=UPI00122E6D39|nr:hypothetical protein [Candidatus Nitrosocosmicus sp. SS]KAA2283196.1 hypothetical protein F1Z66_03715 [Candidatus Nitrosocosmicus sp. SS]KAF0868651.1 hypothetical protein E5N71_09740 [Candidatus Nitrosocosmicus sp. SS]
MALYNEPIKHIVTTSTQIVYAHNFPPNDYSKFIASLDQFQVESNLIKENLVNNNISLAQKHANEANSIYYWDLLVDIVKQNKTIGDELKVGIGDLRNSTLSLSEGKATEALRQQAIQQSDKLVNLINSSADKIITDAAALRQTESSDPFSQISGFFANLFGTANNSNDTSNSIHPIRFADLLDNVLRNYGDAYNVKFDMTDMANMANIASTNDTSSTMSHNMTGNMNSGAMHDGMVSENNEPIVNMANYQSADGMAKELMQIYSKELKPLISNEDKSGQISDLENGIRHLITSIENKDTPLQIMNIVHTQIHPPLIQAFNLQIISS